MLARPLATCSAPSFAPHPTPRHHREPGAACRPVLPSAISRFTGMRDKLLLGWTLPSSGFGKVKSSGVGFLRMVLLMKARPGFKLPAGNSARGRRCSTSNGPPQIPLQWPLDGGLGSHHRTGAFHRARDLGCDKLAAGTGWKSLGRCTSRQCADIGLSGALKVSKKFSSFWTYS